MKKLVLLFSALIFGTSGIMANSTLENKVAERNAYRFNNSFIFVENGVTFSVYPDGEFDFYIESYVQGRRNGLTMNSGFDYSPYAQYDDYGAVIQVENVPVFYDYYGRVSQIGDVDIRYRNNRVRSLGGMYVYYNNRGFYDYHRGFINTFNRVYVYRPFHAFFARPAVGFCLVYNRPYRRFYSPVRYTYYNPYRFNTRRTYAKIGREHRYNSVRRERASIYRNDKRVAVRNNNRRGDIGRSNRNMDRTTTRARNSVARVNKAVQRNGNVRSAVNNGRATTRARGNSSTVRSNSGNRGKTIQRSTIKKGSANVGRTQGTRTRSNTIAKAPKRNTVATRSVTRTPRSTTVTRSRTTYKAPKRSTAQRSQRSSNATKSRSTVSRNSRATSSRSSGRSVRRQ